MAFEELVTYCIYQLGHALLGTENLLRLAKALRRCFGCVTECLSTVSEFSVPGLQSFPSFAVINITSQRMISGTCCFIFVEMSH